MSLAGYQALHELTGLLMPLGSRSFHSPIRQAKYTRRPSDLAKSGPTWGPLRQMVNRDSIHSPRESRGSFPHSLQEMSPSSTIPAKTAASSPRGSQLREGRLWILLLASISWPLEQYLAHSRHSISAQWRMD